MKYPENKITIKQWNEDDRPREKMLHKGRSALSDAELIAILIGSGNRNESAVDLSKRILASAGNNLNQLGKLNLNQLMEFKGIGEAKAISIAAALELGRRRRAEDAVEKNKITASKSVFELMQPLIGELPHEEFWVIYLNNSNQIIQKKQLSMGTMTGTLVDVRIVLKIALECNAISIILIHNHPSGNLNPSEEDKKLTAKLKNAVQHLDITVLDHIIVTESSYFSFADSGIL